MSRADFLSLEDRRELLACVDATAGGSWRCTAGKCAFTVRWSCFLGQFCGLSKMHLVAVHAAFRICARVQDAGSGVRLSRAV